MSNGDDLQLEQPHTEIIRLMAETAKTNKENQYHLLAVGPSLMLTGDEGDPGSWTFPNSDSICC